VLAVLSRQRKLMAGLAVLLVITAPLFVSSLLPAPVSRRIAQTFQPERGQATIRLGGVAFDPSTSERLISMQQAFRAWAERPFLGWGVTGFKFMDTQYARTLVETGLVGFGAFLALLWAIFRSGLASLKRLELPEDRGLALGFVAGLAGLMFHAIGANTFIIVRIMEPFWFFAGIVVALPTLPPAPARAAVDPARAVRYAL
jgi:O-antigen ligase